VCSGLIPMNSAIMAGLERDDSGASRSTKGLW
jgi:hypothetical protein